MNCEFCSVTAFNGQRYRRRPPEDVLDELETISQKMLFFVDDNIIGYGKESRKQALALFKGMVERKLDKLWFCQASLNFADDEEVLHWAGQAGCRLRTTKRLFSAYTGLASPCLGLSYSALMVIRRRNCASARIT
jgi:radical SAM superfamily enzyme YgiQ (UPF0313 family)